MQLPALSQLSLEQSNGFIAKKNSSLTKSISSNLACDYR